MSSARRASPKRQGGVATRGAALVAAYVVPFAISAFHLRSAFFDHVVLRMASDHTWETENSLFALYRIGTDVLASGYAAGLFAATIALPLGLLIRTLARARVRAGFADPLDRARRFAAGRVLVLAPAVAWAAMAVRHYTRSSLMTWDGAMPSVILPAALALAVHAALSSRGWRALLAPTLAASEAEGDHAHAEGFTFNAVAVTKETIGAVGALAALSLVMAGLAWALPTPTLVRNPAFLASLIGYIALAAGSTALFRRVSRISVGLDGIFIGGSARARFISFREIDGARASGSNLELLRGERIVMRLQLHGEDAMRRDALAERIRAAIAVAEAQRNEPAVEFVQNASTDALDRAAGGAGMYREAAPSREKLWEALESPAVDAAGRKAAATALARDGSPAERVRLRIAAEQCAEPTVRARIQELVEELHEEPAPEPQRHTLAAR